MHAMQLMQHFMHAYLLFHSLGEVCSHVAAAIHLVYLNLVSGIEPLKLSYEHIICIQYYNYNVSSKCKNIFTKMLKDVGMEVPKCIKTRSKFSMHADKGRA